MHVGLPTNARCRQIVPKNPAFRRGRLSGVKDQMTTGMTRLFQHLPCIPFHRLARAHKQGANIWRKPGSWIGGGCLSAPRKRGCMSHTLGFTRPQRVANHLFTFATNIISLATTRAAPTCEIRLFGAGNGYQHLP